VTIDCDVLQADGGTRTASITGGYVALGAALITYGMERLLVSKVAAVSVGIVGGVPMLDLCYEEDVRAETDMNVVATGRGLFVEVQGTAEGAPFDRDELDALLELALAGTTELAAIQRTALEAPLHPDRGEEGEQRQRAEERTDVGDEMFVVGAERTHPRAPEGKVRKERARENECPQADGELRQAEKDKAHPDPFPDTK
jgi:hypothetical protein